jgi:hypothetical protein
MGGYSEMLFFAGMNHLGIPLTLTLSLQGRENKLLIPSKNQGFLSSQEGETVFLLISSPSMGED